MSETVEELETGETTPPEEEEPIIYTGADDDSGMSADTLAYGCSCGFAGFPRTALMKHFWTEEVREDKKNGINHDSIGRVDLTTGDVVMPPWKDRTPAQREQSRGGLTSVKAAKTAAKAEPKRAEVVKPTNVLDNASLLRFTPRFYTVDYSPIMRGAQEAAIQVWGWRQDMPLGNFLDTVIYWFFREHGIRLAAYVVEDEEADGNNHGHPA